MNKQTVFFFFLVSLIVSCAKQRPEKFIQGQGIGLGTTLLPITKKITNYTLTTGKSLYPGKASNASLVTIASNAQGIINNLDIVEYKTNSKLLKGVPFRGKNNFTYKIIHEFTDNGYLVVKKVGKKADLPTQELTYAKKLGGDLYAVPLVGYKINFIKVEKVKDGNGEETTNLTEFPVSSFKLANYYRIDFNERTVFKDVKKYDVFPSDMFDGEWFIATTTVSANFKEKNSEGESHNVDMDFEEVSRIKFIKTKDDIKAVNLNVAQEIAQENDEINYKSAIRLPVSWVDYQVRQNNADDNGLEEEEINDLHPKALKWGVRKFVKVYFKQVDSAVSTDKKRFHKLEIAKDFISFTIYYPDVQKRIKYALRKAHKPLLGQTHYESDQRLFGFFTSERSYIKDYKFYYKEDYEEQVKINRLYPKDNKITYHFTHETAPEYRDLGVKMIQQWNEAFKVAGTGITVELDTSHDVELGDIRYNIINVVDTKYGSSLVGFGPSIFDSLSGEIVSATTNIYINPYREGVIETLRNYIKYKLGVFNSHYLNTKVLSSTLASGRITQLGKNATRCGFVPVFKDIIGQIETLCKNDLLPYIKTLNPKKPIRVDRSAELKNLRSCSDKLIRNSISSSLLHELGHNFGLTHNFAASSDKQNFYKKEHKAMAGDPNNIPQTSSTMDYFAADVRELVLPGLYDIAAIRFGYTRSLEFENKDKTIKKIINIPSGTSVDNFLQSNNNEDIKQFGLKPKKYRFCDDFDLGEDDPMCRAFDVGTTPLEVVNHLIDEYKSHLIIEGRRYDRAIGPVAQLVNNFTLNRLFVPMKSFYNRWRYHLGKYVTKKNRYLENYTKSKYLNEILPGMAAHPYYGEYYRQYYQASQKIYQFFKEVITTPTRSCIVKDEDNDTNKFEIFEFEQLRADIFNTTGTTIMDCDDAQAMSYLKTLNKEYLTKSGHIYNNLFASLGDKQNANDDLVTVLLNGHEFQARPVEVIGMKQDRLSVITMLTTRDAFLKQHKREKLKPTFMDEPQYRQELMEIITDRILKGVSSKRLQTKGYLPKDLYFPQFILEKGAIKTQFSSLLTSLTIPGNLNISDTRQAPYKAIIRNNNEALPEGSHFTKIDNQTYYATDKNYFAKQVIDKYKFLKDFTASSRDDLEHHKQMFDELSYQELEAICSTMFVVTVDSLSNNTLQQLMDGLRGNIKKLEAIESPAMETHLATFLDFEGEVEELLNQSKKIINEKSLTQNAFSVIGPILDATNMQSRLMDDSQDRIEDYSWRVGKYRKEVSEYLRAPDEYDTQLDLLSKLIRGI
ncbi:MAG: zinc-dependent metalloprotease [Bacteriovoracaceae bacterium]|nr:zinc-dependent metalloprotease [Bacteriovoracaceae bacterium]